MSKFGGILQEFRGKFGVCFDWVSLEWVSLKWLSFEWVGFDWVMLVWEGLEWENLEGVSLEWVSLEWVWGNSIFNFQFQTKTLLSPVSAEPGTAQPQFAIFFNSFWFWFCDKINAFYQGKVKLSPLIRQF